MNELTMLQAKQLDMKIKTAAQLAQQSLYEMCMAFKEMRDKELYKELGYSSFEDYCEQETGFSRRNVYNYISIAEKLPEEFVNSSSQIGVKKLTLLAKLSDDERQEVAESITDTTVKELQEQIKLLRQRNDDMAADQAEAHKLKELSDSKAEEVRELQGKIKVLQAQIKQLEDRPIEVAVQEDSEEKKALQERIDALEDELRRCNDTIDKLQTESTPPAEDARKTKFKAYLLAAGNALESLITCTEELDSPLYSSKVVELLKNALSHYKLNVKEKA